MLPPVNVKDLNIPTTGLSATVLLRRLRKLEPTLTPEQVASWLRTMLRHGELRRRNGRFIRTPRPKVELGARALQIYAAIPSDTWIGYCALADKLCLGNISGYLDRLHKRGLIKRVGRGRWTKV